MNNETALEYVIRHAGNLIGCPDEELAYYGKLAILEALCIYWGCFDA